MLENVCRNVRRTRPHKRVRTTVETLDARENKTNLPGVGALIPKASSGRRLWKLFSRFHSRSDRSVVLPRERNRIKEIAQQDQGPGTRPSPIEDHRLGTLALMINVN